MGRSTVEQLINRAKAMNDYNNSGISSNAQWVDFFNAALIEMVDDLSLEAEAAINFDPSVRLYDLPEDYYGIIMLLDENGRRILKRRHYEHDYPAGYWIFDRGSHFQIDLAGFNSPQTMVLVYIRYPEQLDLAQIRTQRPEVPTSGETALCYKAIKFALLNNNIPGQADYYESLYRRERYNVRNAAVRARGI